MGLNEIILQNVLKIMLDSKKNSYIIIFEPTEKKFSFGFLGG